MTGETVVAHYSSLLDYSSGVITEVATILFEDCHRHCRSFDSMDYLESAYLDYYRREDCFHPILLSFLRVLAGSGRQTAAGAPVFAVVIFAQ